MIQIWEKKKERPCRVSKSEFCGEMGAWIAQLDKGESVKNAYARKSITAPEQWISVQIEKYGDGPLFLFSLKYTCQNVCPVNITPRE